MQALVGSLRLSNCWLFRARNQQQKRNLAAQNPPLRCGSENQALKQIPLNPSINRTPSKRVPAASNYVAPLNRNTHEIRLRHHLRPQCH
jgi:hypothetical protein